MIFLNGSARFRSGNPQHTHGRRWRAHVEPSIVYAS